MARKEKNIHYIYKTTCNVTGRWYIGMHSTNNDNDGYMGSGKRLRHSIRKYGVDNHIKEILEYCDSRGELVLKEIGWITGETLSDPLCMNLMSGGTGGFHSLEGSIRGGKLASEKYQYKLKNDSEFLKKHIYFATINITNFNKRGVKTKGFINKSHSDETKQLMSDQRKGTGTGETNSQYGTCWITRDGLNKKVKKGEVDQWIESGWSRGRK